ncbi:MAG TPA: DUF885 domain-containing protein [Candidatus Marinimicrobia bacterium]|jgi:uncharacterized protein (DUF885 family)|nr:DUF885 domain-containing protein [Candidatus Neomarinimicrobiota bacterium]MDP7436812.1 DUF885 domain-containing protein [Candidatus Neomarinimicrobiota bacterium]MDP7566495.1 DUF885 domain-containing protein [Candidatus Neomarinimicrobiota bacterium]MDP7653482.1 DUF885 domain-containing protein [Candidatus Neomarinimicrobiota bacterium]HJL74300.1 DUF885 domain-containing protein [Candidatus Neomarinimicrobiota bacterium]|tara:strand:+ start:3222 stop:4976 length:1755 start_codon:yes stop_codon:yes gene_type:complete
MNSTPLKNVILFTALVALTIYFIMKNAPTFQFHSVRDDFMDWHFANNPTSATWIGIHDYDGELPDISTAGREKERSHLERVQAELENIDPDGFNDDDRIDRQILLDMIESSFFNMDELQSFSWNPLQYIWGLGYAYESLLAYDFASVEERAENLSRRFLATSEYLSQARENLVEFPKPHLETAIKQAKGLASMFDSSVPEMAEQLKDDYRKNFEHNAGLAKQALTEFITFLESHEDDGSFRDFRIGRQLYNKKLFHSLKEGITAPEVMERAEAHLRVVQNEMFALAEPLYEEWFGEKPTTDSHENKLKMTRKVLDRIAEKHAPRDKVVEAARETIAELEQFIKDNDLLTLDDSKPLEIRETPEYQRGVSGASLQSPGPLESNLPTFYNVSPIPEDWTDEQANSFLEEYNTISMKILSIHEALPGHYVQLYYANRHPSLVRASFGSGVMIEGWAHYTEDMMVNAGLGGGDPRYSLVEKKWKLRGISNAIIDQKIHAERMTEQEALDLMINETFQEESEASGKWRRAQLTSAQLSTYFTGYILFLELLEDYKAQEGEDFNIKNFHEELLSYGSIPIRYIREMMIDD